MKGLKDTLVLLGWRRVPPRSQFADEGVRQSHLQSVLHSLAQLVERRTVHLFELCTKKEIVRTDRGTPRMIVDAQPNFGGGFARDPMFMFFEVHCIRSECSFRSPAKYENKLPPKICIQSSGESIKSVRTFEFGRLATLPFFRSEISPSWSRSQC